MKIKIKTKKSGFTIIEALVFLFIFTVSVLAVYEFFNLGMNYIIDNKKKIAAVGLANEQIEKMRNLGYENLTTGATINEEMTKNGIKYYVTTNVRDIDDSADGEEPADTAPEDYRQIDVEVKWELGGDERFISLNTIVVPPVREENADLGYMRLHIVDQDGLGLPGASVVVWDLDDDDSFYSGSVNSEGDLFLVGMDPHLHKIIVGNDNDYYPVETMDETGSFVPEDGHVDIVAKSLIEKSIQTDIESTLNVSLEDTFGDVIPNLGFDFEGGKLLGIEDGTDEVYDFSDSVSGSDGTESFFDMSFGPYFFNFTDLTDESEPADYQFLWMLPISDSEEKIFLDADDTLEAEAILASESVPSLLVTVTDDVAGDPIEGATVQLQLSSDPPSYDVTVDTNIFGKAYFPAAEGDIINGDYDLSVSAGGYDSDNSTVTINDFTSEEVSLTAS